MSRFFDEYSDALTQETLLEMAENFFGERKSLDDEKERFGEQAKVLREFGESCLTKAGLLHALLLNEENVYEFYNALGVKPGPLLLWVEPSRKKLFFPLPFAFTIRGRYIKTVLRAYETVAESFDIYLNGRYYKAPGSKQKRLSTHYKLLKDWAGHINRRIRAVSEGLAPSCVLSFAHGMNVEAMEKERISGATLDNYACSLDESLAIAPVSCHESGLKELPELPASGKAEALVKSFAKGVYRNNKKRCMALVAGLRKASRPLDSHLPRR